MSTAAIDSSENSSGGIWSGGGSGTESGVARLRALAQLAEDKPEAFDALVPVVVPLVMGAASR